MRFYILTWQHKADRYKDALRDAGFILDKINPDVVLFDHDLALDKQRAYRPEMVAYAETGARVFLYRRCFGMVLSRLTLASVLCLCRLPGMQSS
jgi:hypothetical protein